MYAQNQKIGKPNNFKVFEAIKQKDKKYNILITRGQKN